MPTIQTKKLAHTLKKTGQLARCQQMGNFAAIIQTNFKPSNLKP